MNRFFKQLLSLALCMSFLSIAMAQLRPKTKCADIAVDILNGTVNGLKPNTDPEEFKAAVPCFTSEEAVSPTAKCGGMVSYKDKDFYFYTKRKYFEVGPKFQGHISIPVMGSLRNSLFKWLGNPKMKDDLWDAYEMQYGTLVLHYTVAGAAGKVRLIQFTTYGTDELNLCE